MKVDKVIEITEFEYQAQDWEKTNDYSIKEYESNHSDLDAALSDLKNIMIKYLPEEFDIERCRNVLIDLFLFEMDLNKHTLLEHKILV